MLRFILFSLTLGSAMLVFAQPKPADTKPDESINELYGGLKWRNIGPFRGGRSVAATGVIGQPQVYYFGSTGGGIWKTSDAGITWNNISDGQLKTGSIGAIEVAPDDPNVIYVGTGEHAVRGVMTSPGDGMYRSIDAGETWHYLGLPNSRHISEIVIHPKNPDLVWVAVQGAVHGPSQDRGIYKSEDGGKTWRKTLYVDENTGASDLTMHPNNPRILVACMWDHRRTPWQVRSGGTGSGIYQSQDGGETWKKLTDGLPTKMGKAAVDYSPAEPKRLYANIEAEMGGVYRSDDGGKSWTQTCKDRVTIARAWYYIEIFADPLDPETVYVLNAPMLKSIDGGKTFTSVPNPHGDQHDLWINPSDAKNMILANDGGACVSFNGGKSWSSQQNQPTAQFYRVITDQQWPYYVYGGQQDNTSVAIVSRTNRGGIDWKDWFVGPGCECAFVAFDQPAQPKVLYGGCYQGIIGAYYHATQSEKDIMAYPTVGLAETPSQKKYRFNWNAPIVGSPQSPGTIYHGANVVLQSKDGGLTWKEISADLTRDEKSKQVDGGAPYTNEGAGGEIYNTLSYLACSPHAYGHLWAGSDDGRLHFTSNDGQNWTEVSPKGMPEALINSIEISPHQAQKVIVAVNTYKYDDLSPMIYLTENQGKSWQKVVNGIPNDVYVRVVREDPKIEGLLYAGTERGLYISFNNGQNWSLFQLNLPVCPITDITFRNNDMIVSTSGRSFWILDDLSPVQQIKSGGSTQIHIVNGQAAIRMEMGQSTQPGVGQNPLNGMMIDYFLPQKMDSVEVKLNIFDSQGSLVRSYSSKKDSTYQRYDGGPAAEPNIPVKKGLNRFSWDLRREPMPGINKIFIYGDYRGTLVPPGKYTVEIEEGSRKVRQILELKADPRTAASPASFVEQDAAQRKIDEYIHTLQNAVVQVQDLRAQLQNLETALLKLPDQGKLNGEVGELITKLTSWENEVIQPKQKTFQDVINFPNRLISDFMDLRSRMDVYFPALTQGIKSRLEDLEKAWSILELKRQELINNDLEKINQNIKSQNLPALLLPRSKS